MIDHSKKLISLMQPNLLYHIQVMIRNKDGHTTRRNVLISEWFTTSPERVVFLMPGIKALCEVYKARAYFHPSGKDPKMVMERMHDQHWNQCKTGTYSPAKLMATSVAG